MQKLFIRVGSHYYADTPHLDGDLDLTSLIGCVSAKQNEVVLPPVKETSNTVDYSGDIQELNKRIDELTRLVHNPVNVTEPIVEKEAKPKVVKVAKKTAAKKK